MVKFPDDARVVERRQETDAETIRRQPVRGMIRRMGRNRLRLVETLPAQTPFEVMAAWAAELTAKPAPADLADLADRLRDALAFEEDGALAGRRVVEAIDRQADRTCDWGAKSRLRFVGAHVETVLREMGLL
jgi:hypothetical protein